MRTELKITITESGKFYKVELQDHYGNYTQVYEPSVKQSVSMAMNYAENWFAEAEKRYKSNQLHAKAVMEMMALDRKAGIIKGNYDGLD